MRVEADTSINERRVVGIFNELAWMYGLPEYITIDNWPEFISKAFDAWAYERGVKPHFIAPRKPTENPHIESSNDKLRGECLNDNSFFTVAYARMLIDEWRDIYNQERWRSSLGRMIPVEFCRKAKPLTTTQENSNSCRY